MATARTLDMTETRSCDTPTDAPGCETKVPDCRGTRAQVSPRKRSCPPRRRARTWGSARVRTRPQGARLGLPDYPGGLAKRSGAPRLSPAWPSGLPETSLAVLRRPRGVPCGGTFAGGVTPRHPSNPAVPSRGPQSAGMAAGGSLPQPPLTDPYVGGCGQATDRGGQPGDRVALNGRGPASECGTNGPHAMVSIGTPR